MARSRSGYKAETSEEKSLSEEMVLSSESEVESLAPVSMDAPKSKILEPKAAPIPEMEPTKHYRVLNDVRVLVNGQIFIMRAGRIVDEANYDVPLLQSQGVKLESV